jgi:hypothetical protein
MPPYLAGRQKERAEFLRLLGQDVVLENMVLSGLRGVGKTVLLDTFKPLAIGRGWLWVGADLSESTSISEARVVVRNFFAGRWARATDRQRDLLTVIASLENCDEEFTVQEVAERSRSLLKKPFGPSHISQMLAALGEAGLVHKNRHGKYSFAVPLLGRFILRQQGK